METKIPINRFFPVPFMVGIGVIIAFVSAVWVYKNDHAQKKLEFESRAEEHVRLIENKIKDSFVVVESITAFYQASEDVSRHEFKTFTEPLLFQNPQIMALQWVPRIFHKDRDTLEDRVHARGYENFEFLELDREGDLVRAQNRSEYYPVYYVEPYLGNEKAFGFDLGSHPDRLKAVERAWTRGHISITSRVGLVQDESHKGYAFLALDPIFKKGKPVNTMGQKWDQLKGFASGVIRVQDLIETSLAYSNTEGIDLEIFEHGQVGQDLLLYQTGKKEEDQASTYIHESDINIGGHTWFVKCSSYGASWDIMWFEAPLWTFILGVIFTFLVAGYLNLLMKRSRKFEGVVSERTRMLEQQKAEAIELIKIAEAARNDLKESENRFRILADSAPVLIWMSGPDKLCTYFNQSWLKFTGRTFKQELGTGWTENIHPEDLKRCLQVYENAFNARQPFKMEYRLRRYDGQYRWIFHEGTPRYNKDKKFVGYIGCCVDMTERHNWEGKLQQERDKAESAVRLKSEFLANMSHEIRTPMNAIIGMTDICLETNLDSEQKNYIETIQSSGFHLLQLINDILDCSKIEAGRMKINQIAFDIKDVVEAAADSIAYQAGQKGLELVTFINPKIPQSLLGDPDRLRQVIINLTSNAVKFTDKGEIIIRLDLEELTSDYCKIHFSIADSGCGIAPELQSKIFDSFTQADGSIARKYGGTGLGTTISKHLVDMMSGKIWVESPSKTNHVDNPGTTFHVTMQLGIDKRKKSSSHAIVPDLQDKKVLLVDDNTSSQIVYVLLLELWGMQVTAVSRAIDALKINENFDIILTDHIMPEMDGLDFVEKLNEIRPGHGIPIVMLSTSHKPELVQRSKDLGIISYLIKPTKQATLKKVMISGLNKKCDLPNKAGRQALIPASHEGEQILLVEDNKTNQMIAQKFIEKEGYIVTVAENGKEALDIVKKYKFDVILMDMQMPVMDGLEATRAIREWEKQSGQRNIIVAMTANAMSGDKETCLKAGMDNYLTKPIDKKALYSTLASYTRRKAA